VTEPVLLDTNGWIALLNASDTLHESARLIWTQLARERTPIIVTDWVVAETGNGLARFPLHFKQAGFRRLLAQD
jgi:predicted nucleic acid-binding protein